jgi:hypothetical protein
MASAYPDGQFCIQLNGSTPNPIKVHHPIRVVAQSAKLILTVESCVTAVGQTYDAMLYTIRAFHPSIALPSSPTEVEGYYLSCFNQKRSVLLLDDAGSKEQVSHNAHTRNRYVTRWLITVVYRSYRCSPNRRVS